MTEKQSTILQVGGLCLVLWVALGLGGCASVPTPAVLASAPASVGGASRPAPAPSALDTLGLVAYAASMQGKPYVAGGASPQQGFDCSGLVQHVFGNFDFELPRNAASMAAALPAVPLSSIQAADLLFFNTAGTPFSHVGIYLGDGRFVHAPSPRTGRVIISDVANRYWHGRLTGARRPAPPL